MKTLNTASTASTVASNNTLENSMNSTNTEVKVTEASIITLTGIITSALFKDGMSPRRAILAGMALGNTVHLIGESATIDTITRFPNRFTKEVTKAEVKFTAKIGSEKKPEANNKPFIRMESVNIGKGVALAMLDELTRLEFIGKDVDGLFDITEKTQEIINMDDKANEPTPVGMAIDRMRKISRNGHTSDLMNAAIDALQTVEFTVDEAMLEIIESVRTMAERQGEFTPRNIAMKPNDFVIEGCKKLVAAGNNPVCAEWFADTRGRLNQASCFGPNGQSSDQARSTMNSTPADIDWTNKVMVDDVIHTIKKEMMDMGSWSCMKEMMIDSKEAVANPKRFAWVNMKMKNKARVGAVNKTWSFIKFSLVLAQVREARNTGNPVDVMVTCGLDAKCSGPQIGGLLCDNAAIMSATGFSIPTVGVDGELVFADDTYEIGIAQCNNVSVLREMQVSRGTSMSKLTADEVSIVSNIMSKLTRSLIKKSFMAIFYGAGKAAMLNANTITFETHSVLFAGLDEDMAVVVADVFHQCISNTFGEDLNALRRMIKSVGLVRDEDGRVVGNTFKEGKDGTVQYNMPDGFSVEMNYMEQVNIHGISTKDDAYAECFTEIRTPSNPTGVVLNNITFNTEDYDRESFTRTGFVNLIQACDALLARLIVTRLHAAGVKAIVSIHDCFRVGVLDQGKLVDAIKGAYLDMFGSEGKESDSTYLGNTDIVGTYMEAVLATQDTEVAAFNPTHFSQFGEDGVRELGTVGGKTVNALINELGEGAGHAYFFAK